MNRHNSCFQIRLFLGMGLGIIEKQEVTIWMNMTGIVIWILRTEIFVVLNVRFFDFRTDLTI